MKLSDVILIGTRGAQAAATTVPVGTLYYVTDEHIIERSNGTTWASYSASVASLTVEEIDGTPSVVNVNKIKVTNGKLTDSGGGVVSLDLAGGGGSGAWNLIEARNVGSGATENFITSLNYNEILVVLVGVTTADSAILQMLVSIDGGSTYKNTTGDYRSIDTGGIEHNDTTMAFHNTANTVARTSWRTITNFNGTTAPKISMLGINVADNASYRIITTSALNGIRVRPHTGNFNGAGTINVYGR
jgi:hypothetical protein